MTHEDALNLLLAHSCPVDLAGGIRQFYISLHCASFIICAKDLGNCQYEIVSITQEEED